MSEQKKESGGAGGSSVVLVEQSATSRHKPFRPSELSEEPEVHHKRSRAPAVPSVTEDFKDNTVVDTKDKRESERGLSSDKHKHKLAKKLSSSIKKRGLSPEAISMSAMDIETKKGSVSPTQPIPAHSSVVSAASDAMSEKTASERKEEDDSITEDIAELRTPEVAKKSSDWSDEEEASGLPRSESRPSRMSRAVRQLFCCGVRYEAPSEHQLSPRDHAI